MWKNTGATRPEFADDPAPGQESVWDYPRPPAIEPCERLIEIRGPDGLIAKSEQGYRVLETASPPTVYLPSSAVDWSAFVEAPGHSFCEWKGGAKYWALADDPATVVAWAYPEPARAFAAIADQVSFYPGRVECYLDGERVRPQPGGFYGGWITDDIAGPFKGEPGTLHW